MSHVKVQYPPATFISTIFKWVYLLVFLLYQRLPTSKNMYRGELRLSRINPKLAKNQLDSDW